VRVCVCVLWLFEARFVVPAILCGPHPPSDSASHEMLPANHGERHAWWLGAVTCATR
jgi:hypothetical protein